MINLFSNISPRNKDKLLKILEGYILNIKKNNIVSTSVKWDNVIGIVINGYLQITRIDESGNRTIMEDLEENSVFGTTISSLNNNEYEIIAKEDSKIIYMEYNNIINRAEINTPYYNQFIKNLLDIMNEKISDRNNHISILTKRNIRDKLLEFFRITSKKNGSKIIYITLNYSELADYLAVDRCAMSRELKNLTDEGFIKKDGKKITLLY